MTQPCSKVPFQRPPAPGNASSDSRRCDAHSTLGSTGVLVWVGLVAALPSLIGVVLAARAKRAGAGTAATLALIINIALPIGWIALQVLRA